MDLLNRLLDAFLYEIYTACRTRER